MERQIIEALQRRLADLGWYTGRVDGDAGPLTSMAVIDFKRAVGYRARDYVGPLTLQALFSPGAPKKPDRALPVGAGELPWIAEARSHLGVREHAGIANNPLILDWAENLDQHYPGDDVPWCGLFVAHCMAVGAPEDPQDFNRLGARKWGNYGREIDPCYGSIGVFWRSNINSWQGHVSFLIGEDSNAYHVLGGNQSDSVSVIRIAKSRFLKARWPLTVPVPDDLPALLAVVGGGLSSDES